MFFLCGRVMPTSCAVSGCTNRHRAGVALGFFRFPCEPDRLCLWLVQFGRRKPDGSAWEPGLGDRVCGDHFLSGRPSCVPQRPDYVPSLRMRPILASASSADDDTHPSEEDGSCSAQEQAKVISRLERIQRARERCHRRTLLSEEREARAAAEAESRKRMADTTSADHCYCGLTDDQLDDKSSRTASPAFKVLRKAAALGPEIEPILVEVEVNTDLTIPPSTVTKSEGLAVQNSTSSCLNWQLQRSRMHHMSKSCSRNVRSVVFQRI